MKRIAIAILSLITITFALSSKAQTVKTYDAEWKKVEDFVKKGLPASALTEAKKIYVLAKKEKQDAQVIKSLSYMAMLQESTRENNDSASIREIEKDIPTLKESAAAIANSLLAEMYWQYYQNRRWNMYNTTATVSFVKTDLATWSAEDFHEKVGTLYKLSLKNERLLQQTSLKDYDALIIKGNVRHLRPTLYDLLAHRALDYFENDERYIKKPAYAFEIAEASAFDPAADFVHRKFKTQDTLSVHYNALVLFQRLLAFHLNDKNPDALLDADLRRYEFVRGRSTHPDKETLYFNGVNHLAHQYENTPAAAQAWYLVAAFYDNRANTYSPFDDTAHRYDRVLAKEICEKVLGQKDSSEGRINCYNLLTQINRKQLQFNVEKVNLPDQPFRAQIDYRNIGTLHIRLVAMTDKIRTAMENQYDESYWSNILAAPVLRKWQQTLPATNDYQSHKVEIKIDALLNGEYLMIAGSDADFSNKKTVLGARKFYVSSISYINNVNDYFVLDRDNGQPLVKATVQLWERKYDYKLSKYIQAKGKLYTTDANGFFRIPKPASENNRNYANYNFALEINYNKDHLYIDDYENLYYARGEMVDPKTVKSVFLFTDRSLYRPGQTLFFKGIAISKTGRANSQVLTDYKTKIYLKDVNGQTVDSLSVSTNEFGSFSGKFQLPSGLLNGQFTLVTSEQSRSEEVRVEEYKRPKFYVDYDTLKQAYRVNDTITITGFAKAYAGNNIDGAVVKYRVVRQPRFIYFWRSYLPPVSNMEITHGEIKTDKNGKFVVRFAAIPDLKIDKKNDPVFDYVVYADVTDINGETRSGSQTVSVGYKSLILQASLPATLPADSLKSISISAQNLAGQPQHAVVKVTITPLLPEQRLIRYRYWNRPDQFVMSKEEYIRNFPHDEYANETDRRAWAKGTVAFTKTDSIRSSSPFKLEGASFKPGHYMIEFVSIDKDGQEVKDVKYIELTDEKTNKLAFDQYFWVEPAKPAQPGEKAVMSVGSSAENVFMIEQVDKTLITQKDNPDYNFIRFSNEKKRFEYPISEQDRGGFGVSYAFVKNNRFYQGNQAVYVPWNNKDLIIEYASYRDKTLPGSEEKWKLKISGYKNEKVATAVLASMYDASLDQFYPHNWSTPSLWPTYYQRSNWDGGRNFSQLNAFQRPWVYEEYKNLIKTYDVLSAFQSMYLSGGLYGASIKQKSVATESIRIRGNASMPAPAAMARAQMKEGEDKDLAFLADQSGVADTTTISGSNLNSQNPETTIRRNFNETAFFFPDLRTDTEGNLEFSFTIPEALTRWKFQALAHSKDLSFGYSSKEIITQKQLMVQPNAPRFMREGDKMEFSAKIVNLTDKEITGSAEFQLFDAATNEPVDGRFQNMVPNQYFTVAAGQSESVNFPIEVPYQFNKALVWRIVAKAGNISDGEEAALPVLTNRMLVTESIGLPMNGVGTKEFKFEKLLQSANSETIQHHALTVEYTSNPAWYAVQALPYLMEYPYDCAEQTWNRYYANSLASMIANSSPRLKQIFEQWKTKDTAALLSNLQKNQELKSVLLEETPWVLQAKTEAQQKQNIALLFDIVRMSGQLTDAYEKLKQMQSENGGFVWFKGGPDDQYMTQYIVTGIGHLKKLNSYGANQETKLKQILAKAIPYLDAKLKRDYDELVKNKTDLKKYVPGSMIVQYFYMRSFFPEYKIATASQTAYIYFIGRLPQAWLGSNKYMQGMIALISHRKGDAATAAAILKSLKETSINNTELGRYWKDQNRSWWWYEAPLERQALLIEAFQEAGRDTETVDQLRTWLLKNKQTNNWESTKATAEACYALLLQGSNWLSSEPVVTIQLGNFTTQSTSSATEAGTGYMKKTIDGGRVLSNMGNIAVNVQKPANAAPNQNLSASWGAVYWQYFEDLDKITTASTPLRLDKKLFIETNTDRGPVLTPLKDGNLLKVGDKVKVRIELRVDRDMEYVHMKDMRASAMEPVNVLSGYRWQNGLGYYETTKDASTNFFFSSLRKGTYVFEYSLFASQAGNFSNGVTTIQSMYAPEFMAHSEGIRVNIEK